MRQLKLAVKYNSIEIQPPLREHHYFPGFTDLNKLFVVPADTNLQYIYTIHNRSERDINFTVKNNNNNNMCQIWCDNTDVSILNVTDSHHPPPLWKMIRTSWYIWNNILWTYTLSIYIVLHSNGLFHFNCILTFFKQEYSFL